MDGDLLSFASILRNAAQERDPRLVWRVKGIPNESLYVAPVACKFFFEPTLARLRATGLRDELTFETVTLDAIPAGMSGKPLVALQWVIGEMIGAAGLLPWLKADQALRLKSWPIFPCSTTMRHTGALLPC